MKKHCPYCRKRVEISENQSTGVCDYNKCGKTFEIRYRLSKITLEQILEYRDFEAEIYNFILNRKKTYPQEIAIKTHVSKGTISQVVTKLESEDKITVDKFGKTKWIKVKVK